MNPRARVLAYVASLLRESGQPQVAVSARKTAAACDLTPDAAAGVLTALVKEGSLRQLRSHRSSSNGRRKRSRVLALPS